jgi:WD repeat-containing protein 23
MHPGNDGDDDDDDVNFGIRRRRRRPKPDPNRFPKVPSDAGIELMNSGNFGTNELQGTGSTTEKKHLARRILDRELGIGNRARQKANQRLMAQVLYLYPKQI